MSQATLETSRVLFKVQEITAMIRSMLYLEDVSLSIDRWKVSNGQRKYLKIRSKRTIDANKLKVKRRKKVWRCLPSKWLKRTSLSTNYRQLCSFTRANRAET